MGREKEDGVDGVEERYQLSRRYQVPVDYEHNFNETGRSAQETERKGAPERHQNSLRQSRRDPSGNLSKTPSAKLRAILGECRGIL